MSIERPAKGVLSFQCEVCYETHEFSKAEGDPIHDGRACWAVLHEEGWRIFKSEHLCEDCAEIAKTERERVI